jgi:hypothetical protein
VARTTPLITLVLLIVALVVAQDASAAISVQIVNQSGKPAGQVYVMLSGGSSSDGQLSNEVATKLGKLRRSQFTLSNFSGRIYFSYGAPVTSAEPPTWPTRYDKVELTYPGVANLTAVDFFGIPFKLLARNARGNALGTLAWSAPTDTIEKALLAIPGARRALVKARGGGFARILSPQLSPSSYPSLKQYVGSVRGIHLNVSGSFFGNPFQTFAYSARFGGLGTTTLNGTITPRGGRRAGGAALGVAGSTLPAAIYTVDGPYTWGGATHRVSDNDVYAVVYRDLIAGFAWGYWGGKYGNDSARWQNKPPFEAARLKRTKPRYATYNEYAAVVYRYSNAYGFSFSDTGAKKVQLPLTGAATLQITILPDRKKR